MDGIPNAERDELLEGLHADPPKLVLGPLTKVWGHNTITRKQASGKLKFGYYQVICYYHRKNPTTWCNKTVTIRGPSLGDRISALYAARHWSNQSSRFTRQYLHPIESAEITLCPSLDFIRAHLLEAPPPSPVLDDMQLDDPDFSEVEKESPADDAEDKSSSGEGALEL